MRFQDKLSKLQPPEKPQLYIGGIFPITGTKYKAPELAAVAMIAVKDVNNDSDILPGHQLSLDINDGQCEADVVMKRFIDIIKTNDASKFRSTVGMLGPACSDTVEPIAGVSKHFRTVVISYSAEGTISNSNSKEYPYFFRTIAENKQYKFAYIQTMKRLGWSKVAALTQDGQKYSDYMPALQDEFQANHFEFMENRKFPEEVSDVEKMKEYLEGLKEKGAKVIIGEFYASSARIVMCTAYKLEMTQREGYVWFLPGWYDPYWYDVDSLKLAKAKNQQTEGPRDSSDGTGFGLDPKKNNIGPLPDCTTYEMLQALNGHLSNNQVLVHVKAGNTLTIPQGIKSQMALLLRTCFSHTPTKRPTAAEIVELLLKHPRVVSPCIDVPLASVQIERTDSLEMMPKPKRATDTTSQRAKMPHLKTKPSKELNPEDQGYGSAYSPMNGKDENLSLGVREPLMESFCQDEEQKMDDGTSSVTFPESADSSPYILAHVGSYVPAGYIMLDHSPVNESSPYSKSVSSI